MIKNIGLIFLALTAISCTTMSGEYSLSQRSSTSKVTFDKTPIVHQTSGRSIMRTIGRDAWVELRNSTKNEHLKLYAALGAAEWDVAAQDARSYLQSFPKDEISLTVLALALAMKRNYSLSAYYAKLLEDYYPGNPEVHNLLGLALMNKAGANYSDFQEAKRQFELAFDGAGNQIASGLNLAFLHLQMGNADAAREMYLAVKPRCGQCNEANLGYGIALSRLRDFEKSEAAFTEVLRNDPKNAYARYYLALVAKYGKSDNREAMAQLSTILESTDSSNIEMQRKANFLLRRIQAEVYGKPKDEPSNLAVSRKEKATVRTTPSEAQDSFDIEKAIDTE